jgi:cytochrome c-type biogenesis protein CcmH/NrfG
MWLLQPRQGELRLARDLAEVIRLILERRIDRHAKLYEVNGEPSVLGDLPALAELFTDEQLREFLDRPDSLEGRRAPGPSEEVPYLDSISPLGATEDAFAEDFYEPAPRRRAPVVIAIAAALVILAGGGYLASHRASARTSAEAIAGLPPARVAPAAPAPLPPPTPAPSPPAAVVAAAAPARAPAPRQSRAEPAPRGMGRTAPRVRTAGVETNSPRTYEELVREGEKQVEAGRANRAMDLFDQALRLNPEGPEALNGMGYGWLDRGDPRRATLLFQRAFWKDGHLAAALFGLGEAYRAQDRRKEARDAFHVYLLRFPAS